MIHTRKKIALLIGALIIGQAITMQNMHGMEEYITDEQDNPTGYELYYSNDQNNVADQESFLNSLSYVYNAIKNQLSNLRTNVAETPMYNQASNQLTELYNNVTDRPIAKATKATIQFASWSKPVTAPVLGAYVTYSYLPSIISYPLLTWALANGIQSVTQRSATNNALPHPNTPSITSQILAQINEGAQEAGITAETIQTTINAVKTFVNPTEAIKHAYQTGKTVIETVKKDTIDRAKDEINTNIRHALNIPAHQDVNFDTITDKLTNKVKTEVRNAKNDIKDEIEYSYRRALNIPDNQDVNFDTITDKVKGEIVHAKDAIKNEIEHNYRVALNIPAEQPVNVETVAKKLLEDPARKIFNIGADEEVNADAVLANVAKNTVYRFGIPVAALVAATPIAITAGYFGCKYAYHRLTTEPEPPIFIESSEKSRWQNVKDFVLRNTDEIPELAYSEELEKTFDLITRSSINAFYEIQDGKKNIFYEPILMHGAPGTGKTAKAKQMIKQIYQATNGQMQWRITNGSMLLNAGQNGINKMFDWLKKQPAACLFIDEADTLFPDRDEMEKYPERLEIVNHLLSLIGERSNKYMIIMTTNRLGAFDDAMARRIDNLIHIPLPNEQGRDRVFTLNRDNMLLNQQSSWMMKTAEKYCPQLFKTNKVNVE